MAVVGLVVPEGNQAKEGFHGLRRTTEGLLYYTKVDKDNTDTIDFEGGSPTDANGNKQISNLKEYVNEDPFVQAGETQYETGDGSTLTFDMNEPVLDDTRVCVYLQFSYSYFYCKT